MLAAIITTVLFSLSAVCGRQLSHHLSGTLANLIRLLLGAVMLGAWSHVFGFGIGGAAFPLLFLSGCIGFGIGDLALFQTFPRIGTRRSMVLVQCMAAPFGAVIEWLWLGHAPTLAQTVWGAMILTGVGVALLPGKANGEPIHGLRAGIIFGTVAAIAQAMGAVLSRKAYEVAANAGQFFEGISDGVNAAYQRILGGIFVTALFFVYLKLAHKPTETRRQNWPKAWPWLISNTVAGPTLGVACYQWALMSAPTNIVLPIVATTPLVVIPMAHYMEGDRVTKRAIIGSLIAVAGVVGLTLAR